MRGADTFTESLFTMRRLDDFVPDNHPLRPVRKMVNAALKNIEPLLSGMYAAEIRGGRPSIAPEKLLRAMLLQIFYSIRSERLHKSLADIERRFRVLKSDIEIGPAYHRLPQRIRSHALVCFMALILYRVMRMRLSSAKRAESPGTLLEQLRRIHQQTVQTADGKTLTGLTEMTPAQKSLFAALELALPTPDNLTQPAL